MNNFMLVSLVFVVRRVYSGQRAVAGTFADDGTHELWPTHFTKRRKVSKDNYSQSIGNGK